MKDLTPARKYPYSELEQFRLKIRNLLSSEELKQFLISRLTPIINEDAQINNPPEFFKNDLGEDLVHSFPRKDGALAGGAIGNLINEFIYHVPAVINDLDFFYFNFTEKNLGEASENLYTEMNTEKREKSGYIITNTTEEGLLNKVEFRPTKMFSNWRYLTDSFDLNCVKVGFHWQKKEIFFSYDYVDFLVTRQIKMGNVKSLSLTSLIRAHFKKIELNASFFMKDNLEFFLFSDNIVRSLTPNIKFKLISGLKELEDHPTPHYLIISQKRLALLNKHPHIFEPYFKLEDGYLIWTGNLPWVRMLYSLKPKKALNPLLRMLDDEFTDHQMQEKIFNRFITLGKSGISNYLHKISDPLLPEITETSFIPNSHSNKILNVALINEAFAERLEFIIKSGMLEVFEISDVYDLKPEVFQKSFSETRLMALQNFLHEHNFSGVAQLLIKYEYSINDLIDLLHVVKKMPLHLVGTMETLCKKINNLDRPYGGIRDLVSLTNSSKVENISQIIKSKNYAALKEILELIYADNLERNVLRPASNLKFFKFFIKELVLQSELTQEGEKMNHCVGGYGNNVRRGMSRIFHINFNGVESTLEIGLRAITPLKHIKQRKKPRPPQPLSAEEIHNIQRKRLKEKVSLWVNKQHRASHNRDPLNSHLKLAELFIRHLNNYQTVEHIFRGINIDAIAIQQFIEMDQIPGLGFDEDLDL